MKKQKSLATRTIQIEYRQTVTYLRTIEVDAEDVSKYLALDGASYTSDQKDIDLLERGISPQDIISAESPEDISVCIVED